MPGYGFTLLDAGWVTASEYDHHYNIKRVQSEHVLRVFQWLDLHEARIVPARSFDMERTYYNPRQYSTPSTFPGPGTPMSVSPIPDIAEPPMRALSPTYSPSDRPTLRYPPPEPQAPPQASFPNYIVISDSDDELEKPEQSSNIYITFSG
jgi:hypothetical protein